MTIIRLKAAAITALTKNTFDGENRSVRHNKANKKAPKIKPN